MSDDKVVNLFGVPVEVVGDEDEVSANEVFERVQDADFNRVLVVGLDHNSSLGFATNFQSRAEIVFVMEHLKALLINGDDLDV